MGWVASVFGAVENVGVGRSAAGAVGAATGALAAAGALLEGLKVRYWNLRRWQESGWPRRWVEARRGRWQDEDWRALLDDLRRSPFWAMAPEAVGLVLEEEKRRWGQRS